MGHTISRLYLDIRHFRRRRSQQDETMHGYTLNKNYFCNYFYMGGERFDVNDPNYLFGDNCDLNFLTCTKPYAIPYKKAQQNLLLSLSTKQKAINKTTSRMSSLSSPLNILTGRHRHISQSHKQDAQTQTFSNNQNIASGPQPSQPLVVLVHIRKETLRIDKVADNGQNTDVDQTSRLVKACASHAGTIKKEESRESAHYSKIQRDSDTSSIASNSLSAHSTITSKSGYTSVRDIPPSEYPSDENDDCFQDALNDPTNLSVRIGDNDNQSPKIQQDSRPPPNQKDKALDQIYNIEFLFDSEVDCSLRIYYFCNRDVTPNNVAYKPRLATYKSKLYTYKKGLNQKFEQTEHTFQPHLFDEDLLTYKPLDSNGNYNSGAVFPIVIHCTALEGPCPRQSQSLVATIEKSQLDDSYSIKPLKQLLFVDGVQYILQDIYGIENKPLVAKRDHRASLSRIRINRPLRSSNGSLCSGSNMGSHLNISDTASIGDGKTREATHNENKYMSLASENTFECVICMSDERDTMLLPCRHLCLCSSCAQSLRYQASSCPICRCPFKAALNIRIVQMHQTASSSNTATPLVDGPTDASRDNLQISNDALEMHALRCGGT